MEDGAVFEYQRSQAHALAAELAQRTGHSLTQVVEDALCDRLNCEKLGR